ncbi:DUF4169 family protein [Brevundimonas sp.]|uniref:DUF4169 family protein n=1 Tax=Brevundimonas sp. TaxID=1871086 RepID=UPI0025DE05F9|nr:DUF4169 family protein [Brevundimonas sp.]
MAEIINLNRARKQRDRVAGKVMAAENRAAHGRSKAARDQARLEAERQTRQLNGARRDGQGRLGDDPPSQD